MRFMAKHLSLICFICLQSLVCSRLTDGKVSRKHGSEKVKNSGQRKLSQSRSLHLQRKSKEKGLAVNGIRKNILRPLIANCDGPDCCEGPRCVEMPLPIHIEHLKDYPVPVPVREETTENVLHVHIHDSEFVFLVVSFLTYCNSLLLILVFCQYFYFFEQFKNKQGHDRSFCSTLINNSKAP